MASFLLEFVAAGIAEPVDDVTPVTDCILGTTISGTAHTVGKTSVDASPNPDMGVIDTLFFGTPQRQRGLSRSGDDPQQRHDRVWQPASDLDRPSGDYPRTPQCPRPYRASSTARHPIGQGPPVWSKRWPGSVQGKQQSQAESIASRHAEQRLNERIDGQAGEKLERANKNYVDKFGVRSPSESSFPHRFVSRDRATLSSW